MIGTVIILRYFICVQSAACIADPLFCKINICKSFVSHTRYNVQMTRLHIYSSAKRQPSQSFHACMNTMNPAPPMYFVSSLLRNPILNKPNYRLYVIHSVPQIRVLDFQRIKQRVRKTTFQCYFELICSISNIRAPPYDWTLAENYEHYKILYLHLLLQICLVRTPSWHGSLFKMPSFCVSLFSSNNSLFS